MPRARRQPHPLEDPRGLHVGRFLSSTIDNRPYFMPEEEAYYRTWCEHLSIDFDVESATLDTWTAAFQELRRRYYANHPELIAAMERQWADLPAWHRDLLIAAATLDEDRLRRVYDEVVARGMLTPPSGLPVKRKAVKVKKASRRKAGA